MRMYFNEDIDISKIKTWEDVQNLRRSSENDFKELRDTFGYTGNKVNERIAELIFQYNEKVRLRREFYEGKSVDKNLILGTADPKKVDQIDKEMDDSAKKLRKQGMLIGTLKKLKKCMLDLIKRLKKRLQLKLKKRKPLKRQKRKKMQKL